MARNTSARSACLSRCEWTGSKVYQTDAQFARLKNFSEMAAVGSSTEQKGDHRVDNRFFDEVARGSKKLKEGRKIGRVDGPKHVSHYLFGTF